MAKSLLVGAGSATFSQNTNRFCNIPHSQSVTNNSLEGNNSTTFRVAGTLSNFYVRVESNTVSESSTLRTRKNTANGNQSVSVATTATGEFTDTTNTDTIASGDLVCYRMEIGTGGSLVVSLVACIFNSNTQNSKTIHGSNNNAGMSTASSTFYIKMVSSEQQPRETESEAQERVYVAVTLRNFQITLPSNGRTTATTYGTRVNGNNGNQSFSVNGSATGTFQDSSNTDVLAATDLTNCYVTTGTGTGTIAPTTINVIVETTTGEQHNFAGNRIFDAAGTTINANLTRYMALAGGMKVQTTEATASLDVPIKGRLKGLGTYVVTNTVTASSTLRTRVNAGNGAQSLSIGSGATGFFEDASNADTIAAGDNFNYQLVTGATGTSIIIQYMRSVFAFPAPITGTKSLKYAVQTSSPMTLSLKYEVAVEGVITKGSKYSVRSPESTTKGLIYRIVASVATTKNLTYHVVAAATAGRSLKYAVLTTSSIQLSLTYVRKLGSKVELSLRYELAQETQETKITKSLRYVLRHNPFTKKNQPYTPLPPLV